MSDKPDISDGLPRTLAGRIFTFIHGLVLIAMGVPMVIWPNLLRNDGGLPRPLSGKIFFWIWGTPCGIILILFGLLFSWAAFAKWEKEK